MKKKEFRERKMVDSALGNNYTLDDPRCWTAAVEGNEPVDDPPLVNMVQREEGLDEIAPHFVLRKGFAWRALGLAPDQVMKGPFGGMLHENVQVVALDEAVVVPNYVGRVEAGQHASLIDRLLACIVDGNRREEEGDGEFSGVFAKPREHLRTIH